MYLSSKHILSLLFIEGAQDGIYGSFFSMGLLQELHKINRLRYSLTCPRLLSENSDLGLQGPNSKLLLHHTGPLVYLA